MLDILAPRCVMVGDDAYQNLTDDQLYFVATEEEETVQTFTVLVGPSLSHPKASIEISIADLDEALQQFGYTLDALVKSAS